MELATGSSSRADLGAALHRLRSTLARLKAELELAEVDAQPPPVENLTRDVAEALRLLGTVEAAVFDIAQVVVLDDDARLGELTARGLRRLGYQAEARREWTARGDGEVIVFDLGLAAALSAEEKEDVRSARPIVVTGAADPASRALAASFDASDFLIKPVEIDDLAAAVERRIAEGRK